MYNIIFGIILLLIIFLYFNKKDKVEHYYWFRKMPYDEIPIGIEIEGEEIEKEEDKKKKADPRDKIGNYFRELNVQFEDIGPIDKYKYWYLRIPCPREIRDIYKKQACKERKCAFYLACYKRK